MPSDSEETWPIIPNHDNAAKANTQKVSAPTADGNPASSNEYQETQPISPQQPSVQTSPEGPPPPAESPAAPRAGYWRRVREEGRRSPLAAIAAIAGVLALTSLVFAGIEYLRSDEIEIQRLPDPAVVDPQLSTTPQGSSTKQPWETVVGQLTAPTFILPERLKNIPRPPEIAGSGSQEFQTWALQRGGVYANGMGISFSVRGATPDLSVIRNVKVRVVKRGAPIAGTWILPGGAGGEPSRILLVDLDQDPPTASRQGFDGEWRFPLSVSSEDLEIFAVVVQTKTCDCEWVVDIDYVDSDGDVQRATVDNDGSPFHVTSSANATAEAYAPQTESDPWPR